MKDSKLINIASIEPRRSLNFFIKKKEKTRQIEENLMMLRKIHGAQPSIQNSELLKHEKK
jgi:hypothetical protein